MPRSSELMPLVVLVMSSGCLVAPVVLPPPEGEVVTVFVHGYKGARLDTADGEVAWVTPGQTFSAGDRSLALPFEGQREFPRYGPLTPNGTLTKLTVFPGLLQEDAYLSFLIWARDRLPGFVTFAYDWRQDVRTSGKQLCEFITSLGPTKRVRVAGHSMGGLVTMECLQHGPAEVRSRVTHVVFFGAVFGGAPAVWDDLITGSKTLSNRTLMNAEALLTFSSSWQLLPAKSDFTFDASGAPLEAYDAEKYAWGLFSEDDVKRRPEYRAQLSKRLAEHDALWSGFDRDGAPAHEWKALAIVGVGIPTPAGWRLKADGSFDVEHPTMADGDGLVTTPRAQPWPSIRAKVVEIDAEHSAMLRDSRVQALFEDFLKQ